MFHVVFHHATACTVYNVNVKSQISHIIILNSLLWSFIMNHMSYTVLCLSAGTLPSLGGSKAGSH